MKRLVKSLFGLLVLMTLALFALNGYFRFVDPVAVKVRTAAKQQILDHHVHPVSYEQIPVTFRQAIIATEDRRFSNDPGIDPVGIARSLLVDIQKDGYIEGGSTITQQLVDNTLLSKRKTLHRKTVQMVYAIGLYDTMSKQEVFTLYTNVIYFGHGAYGLYNAAETYFGRTPNACNASELTLLAGLPNAPSAYDPFRAISLARKRQRIVLENMVDAGVITLSQSKEIYSEPLRLRK
ncbi:biosynthetic peptidoglycan transglycosylase [Alicyclobacillus dauci]|uniref:Transglycosylase domain-containing protein n=1 Tax=Alicyclobacillus dauci TaxID=1475485 RepID=A0ABY6YXK9_9BACL|nr:biosynthetic peptidoglycan transglycosylase [Alicyclobacillus dauci]WAH35107.1 transglycosylase domain-containing protein [Alicyclobacillus dauci]